MSNMRAVSVAIVVFGVVLAAACGSSGKKTGTTVPNAPATGSGATTTSYVAPTTTTKVSNLNFTTSGTINGVSFSGNVEDSTVTCTATTGNYTQMQWAGDVTVSGSSKQISGDMSYKGGAQNLNTGEVSLVFGGDYQHRVGTATGTLSVAADGKSGTIDAQLSDSGDHATLKGDWKCS